MILIMSNDCLEATEYTIMYPWIPMYNLEFMRLYSSCSFCQRNAYPAVCLRSSHLSSGVDDFGEKGLAFVLDLMTEGILNGRVVALDEVTFAVLHRQGRLACARVRLWPRNCHVNNIYKYVPTDRLPRMAIFRCLTDGAMFTTNTRMQGTRRKSAPK